MRHVDTGCTYALDLIRLMALLRPLPPPHERPGHGQEEHGDGRTRDAPGGPCEAEEQRVLGATASFRADFPLIFMDFLRFSFGFSMDFQALGPFPSPKVRDLQAFSAAPRRHEAEDRRSKHLGSLASYASYNDMKYIMLYIVI